MSLVCHYNLVNRVISESIGEEKKKIHYIIVNKVYRIDAVRTTHGMPSDFMTMYVSHSIHVLIFSLCSLVLT